MVLDQHESFYRLDHNFSLSAIIPCDQTSKLYSKRASCYMVTKYEEEQLFLISREVPEYIYAKYYLTLH